MLFAGNLQLAPNEGSNAVTADAEDVSHNIYPLTVEHVGPVPNQSWATGVIVKLNENMGDLGDVLVRTITVAQPATGCAWGSGTSAVGHQTIREPYQHQDRLLMSWISIRLLPALSRRTKCAQ